MDLTNGSITTKTIKFSLPLMLGNLLQQMYNIADTWVVGRVWGADALAAVGSSYTLMVFLTSILLGLCMGSGVAISMQYGKRAQDSMRRSVFMSFLLIPQIGVTGIWVSVPIGWALADLIGFAAMRWHTL